MMSRAKASFIANLIIIIICRPTIGQASGICTRQKPVTKTIYVTYRDYYQRTVAYSCGFMHVKTCYRYENECCVTREKYEFYTAYEIEKICCDGYHNRSHDTTIELICDPTCKEPCVHGTCTAPETCTCASGYTPNPSDRYACDPICTQPCTNGRCTAPDECTCFAGFSKNGTFRCDPVCSVGCIHGLCTAPETCSCDSGYALHAANKYVCEPVCSEPCSNGVYVAPDTSHCARGYTLKDDNYTCLPVCSRDCKNATCTAPETCTCKRGYASSPGSVCEPECSPGCANGTCTAPQTCECDEGFVLEKDGFTCSPVCVEECVNGFCSSPDSCTCWEGYDANETKVCSPICANCTWGDCVEPESCRCWEGYEDEGNGCTWNCPEGCENGNCTQESCVCELGWRGLSCNETDLAGTTSVKWITSFRLKVAAGTAAGILMVVLGITLLIIKFRRGRNELSFSDEQIELTQDGNYLHGGAKIT